MNNKLKYEQTLPYGQDLINLLNSLGITNAKLSDTLKEKGIYTHNNNKESLLPIFSSFIITPSELSFLLETYSEKELKKKKRSSIIKCNLKGQKLSEILPKINFDEFINTEYENYKFQNKTPNFIIIDNNHARLEYKINRSYGDKNWFEKEKTFSASIDIKSTENGLELTTIGIHTSKETEHINNMFNNFLLQDLKNNSFIEKDELIQKITMKSFNNNNKLIMKFFLNLTTIDISGFLSFDTLESSSIEIDDKEKLPDGMALIKSKAKKSKLEKLRLDGKNIDEIEVIKKVDYHKYIKCWSMTSTYKFNDLKKGKGYCKIKFEFQNNKDKEFEIKIENLVLDDKKKSKRNVETYILEIVDNLKLEKYKQIANKT